MEYKIGDIVQIREDLEQKYYNDFWANDEMQNYKGKITEIINIDEEYKCYELKCDDGDWNWTDDMLKLVIKEPKYKIGDKVRIKDRINWHVDSYEIGKICDITDVSFDSDGNFSDYELDEVYRCIEDEIELVEQVTESKCETEIKTTNIKIDKKVTESKCETEIKTTNIKIDKKVTIEDILQENKLLKKQIRILKDLYQATMDACFPIEEEEDVNSEED